MKNIKTLTNGLKIIFFAVTYIMALPFILMYVKEYELKEML